MQLKSVTPSKTLATVQPLPTDEDYKITNMAGISDVDDAKNIVCIKYFVHPVILVI